MNRNIVLRALKGKGMIKATNVPISSKSNPKTIWLYRAIVPFACVGLARGKGVGMKMKEEG